MWPRGRKMARSDLDAGFELSDRPIRPCSHSIQCSTTGVTKAVVCVILSVGWCI